jgi:hypothetical protein
MADRADRTDSEAAGRGVSGDPDRRMLPTSHPAISPTATTGATARHHRT